MLIYSSSSEFSLICCPMVLRIWWRPLSLKLVLFIIITYSKQSLLESIFSAMNLPPSTRFLWTPSTVERLSEVRDMLMDAAYVRAWIPFGVISLLEISRLTRFLASLIPFESSIKPTSLSLFFFKFKTAIRSIFNIEWFFNMYTMHLAKFNES